MSEFKSAVSKVSDKANSFRTSVPLPVATLLGIEGKCTIIWTVEHKEVVGVRVEEPSKSSKRR